MMLLQRYLVDHDAKQSLYIHKLNRTKKTMAFLRQLNQTPNIYYSFLMECVRRKQYSNIFNQVSQRRNFFLDDFRFFVVFTNNSSTIEKSFSR